jgi:hypothetical protein
MKNLIVLAAVFISSTALSQQPTPGQITQAVINGKFPVIIDSFLATATVSIASQAPTVAIWKVQTQAQAAPSCVLTHYTTVVTSSANQFSASTTLDSQEVAPCQPPPIDTAQSNQTPESLAAQHLMRRVKTHRLTIGNYPLSSSILLLP